MKKCWEINPDCVVLNWKPTRSVFRGIMGGEVPNCIARKSGKGCWEIDWASEIATLSKDDKAHCQQRMKEKCPKCPVYVEHKEELDVIIKKVQEL